MVQEVHCIPKRKKEYFERMLFLGELNIPESRDGPIRNISTHGGGVTAVVWPIP